MSNMHDTNVLKLHTQGSLDRLYETLTKKSTFISSKYNGELTEAVMKKLKHEEEHIKTCLEFIENVDKLIKELDKELACKTMVLDFFKKEAKEYMDKYFDSVDAKAEYLLLKKLIKYE